MLPLATDWLASAPPGKNDWPAKTLCLGSQEQHTTSKARLAAHCRLSGWAKFWIVQVEFVLIFPVAVNSAAGEIRG